MMDLHPRATTSRDGRPGFMFAAYGAIWAAHEPELVRKGRHKMAVVAHCHDGAVEGLEGIEERLHTLQV